MTSPTRLGMLTPSSNTVLEPLTCRMLAGHDEVSAHFSRLRVTKISLDADSSDQFTHESMLSTAALLVDAAVSVLAWNGTAGSWLGPDRDRALVAALSDAGGIVATTSTLAILVAARAVGTARLGLLTPYQADVGAAIEEHYAAEGLPVHAARHLGRTDNFSFAGLGEEVLTEQARALVAAGADCIAVVCTNVAAGPYVSSWEAELGVPVIDSVAATLWHSLRLAGNELRIQGWGSLLATDLGSFYD